MKLLILNGPNLNLLGTREPSIYGADTLSDLVKRVEQTYPTIQFEHIQSNHEGVLIDAIQESSKFDGIIFNAGGYTHTSVAIADALAAVKPKVIEVHLSNVHARESFRHTSLIAPHCLGSIAGFGIESYLLAVDYFLKNN